MDSHFAAKFGEVLTVRRRRFGVAAVARSVVDAVERIADDGGDRRDLPRLSPALPLAREQLQSESGLECFDLMADGALVTQAPRRPA